MLGREVVIVEAARTAIGRGHPEKGVFRGTHPADLLGACYREVLARGGAVALGHPLGSSGARLLTSLLHALQDRDEEVGIATMCCGGGLGTGTLIQRV